MPWSRPWRSSYRTPSVVSLGVCTNIVRHAYNHIRAIETSSILSCCSDILAKWTGLPIVFIVPNTLASLYQYPYPAWFFPPNEIWCVLLRIWWKPSFNFFEQCVHVCTYMKTDIILRALIDVSCSGFLWSCSVAQIKFPAATVVPFWSRVLKSRAFI